MSRFYLRHCLLGLALGAIALVNNGRAWYPDFPDMESFENDNDTEFGELEWDPNPNPNISAFADPNFGGAPPTAYGWQELRTNGRRGIAEEVPSGWSGVTASQGDYFGAIWSGGPGDKGPQGRPYENENDPPLPNPTVAWSYQTDVYIDPAYAPTFGVGGGGHLNGSNSVPDWWWTSAIKNNGGGSVGGTAGYLTETGFTGEIIDDGVSPKVWRLTTTTGGQPYFEAKLNKWYTLEVKYFTNPTDGKLAAVHSIYNQAHTALLYRHTFDHLFLNPDASANGGPLYSWFTYFEENQGRLLIDNLGVAPPIVIASLKGDMDGDGDVDNFDIQPFELALTNATAYQAQYPLVTDYIYRGDINNVGGFDNFDIQPFEALLTSGGGAFASSEAVVPEPGSAVLLGFGVVGLCLAAKRKLRRLSA